LETTDINGTICSCKNHKQAVGYSEIRGNIYPAMADYDPSHRPQFSIWNKLFNLSVFYIRETVQKSI